MGSGSSAILEAGSLALRLGTATAKAQPADAGRAADLSVEGNLTGVGHVSVAIIPAALAIAEQVESDGAALLDALVLGYEVAHRLTTMYPDTRLGPYAAGYHKPGVYAAFALPASGTEGAHAASTMPIPVQTVPPIEVVEPAVETAAAESTIFD